MSTQKKHNSSISKNLKKVKSKARQISNPSKFITNTLYDTLLKKASAKKSRVKSRHGIILDVNTRRKTFTSRKLLNNEIKKLSDFLNNKSTENKFVKLKSGVSISRAEKNRFDYFKNEANKNLKKEWDRINAKLGKNDKFKGNVEFGTGKEIFDDFYSITSNLEDFGSRESIVSKIKTLEMRADIDYLARKQLTYRDNYIESLKTVFGQGFNDIAKTLEDMPLDDFLDLYYTSNLLEIGFVYSKEDWEAKSSQLRSYYNELFKQKQ